MSASSITRALPHYNLTGDGFKVYTSFGSSATEIQDKKGKIMNKVTVSADWLPERLLVKAQLVYEIEDWKEVVVEPAPVAVAGRNDLWLEVRVSRLLTDSDSDRSDVWLTLKCRLLTFNQHCLSFQIWEAAVKPELSLAVAPPPGLASEQHQISCSVAGVFNPCFSFLFCPHFENHL